MIDSNEVLPFIKRGKLTGLPAKRKRRMAALVWVAEHIPQEKTYTEKEFNVLLDKLHSFNDPAALRRELCDFGLVCRSENGTGYRLAPDYPSYEELQERYCGEAPQPTPQPDETALQDPYAKPPVTYSESDLADAAEFRDRIHAQALELVRLTRPEVTEVVDRYPVESYFRQHWDYPGAWYTTVAIPESVKSREALIDTIVRDTLAQYR